MWIYIKLLTLILRCKFGRRTIDLHVVITGSHRLATLKVLQNFDSLCDTNMIMITKQGDGTRPGKDSLVAWSTASHKDAYDGIFCLCCE